VTPAESKRTGGQTATGMEDAGKTHGRRLEDLGLPANPLLGRDRLNRQRRGPDHRPQGKRGLHLPHPRQARQELAVDAGEVLGVLGHQLQQIVRRPRHQVTFQKVGQFGHLPLEGIQQVFRLTLQGNLHKDRRHPPDPARIQQRHITRDEPVLLQPLHPPVTGRRRQVHHLREFGIGDPTLPLQNGQDAAVCCVKFGGHEGFFAEFVILSNNLRQIGRYANQNSKHCHRNPANLLEMGLAPNGREDMKIGCPKEIKPQEFRVGMTPDAAREAVANGHTVVVETKAGMGAGFSDADYTAAGAKILATAEEVFAQADMIVKVKEPQAVERKRLREGQILFTYLHLAPDPEQTRDLLASGATCIAYETVTDDRGGLPLLAPMSEVAGRLAPQVGAWTLQKANGGRGVLLGGVPGVLPAKVLVIGGGVVGTHAAKIASGMGADVTVIDRSVNRLRYLDDVFGGQFKNAYASAGNTIALAREADMIIGGADPRCGCSEADLEGPAQGAETRRGACRCRHRPGRLLRDLARHHPPGPDL